MANAYSTYDAWTPTIWSPKFTEYFKERLVAGKVFADYSDDLTEGGDKVAIPDVQDDFTASDIQTTNGEIDAESITDTKTDLTLNKWKGTARTLTDWHRKTIASKYNLKDAYARSMSHTLARAFDTALLENARDNLNYSLRDSTLEIVSTTLEHAVQILDTESVPKDEAVWIFHPNHYWGDLMNIQKYYDASQFGVQTTPNGNIPTLYGMPIYVTPQVPDDAAGSSGKSSLLVHREAVCFALANNGLGQSGVKLTEKASGEHLRTKFIADIMYGVKSLRSKAGVVIKGKN